MGRSRRGRCRVVDFWVAPADGLSSALTAGPANREALATTAISRGASRLQSQDLNGAIAEFKRAVAYNPNLTVGYQYQGRVFSMMGRRSEAIDAFERAVRTDSTNADARAELAKAYVADQRFAEAEEEMKQLERANPADVGPHASLGYLYLSQGRLAEADTQMTRVTEIAPRDPGAWKSLGLVRKAQGQLTEAVRMFERSMELDPKYVDSISELGFARRSAAPHRHRSRAGARVRARAQHAHAADRLPRFEQVHLRRVARAGHRAFDARSRAYDPGCGGDVLDDVPVQSADGCDLDADHDELVHHEGGRW